MPHTSSGYIDALNNKRLKSVLPRSTIHLSDSRVAAMGAVNGPLLRDQTRQMKEYVIRYLPDLLEQFEANIIENGGHVHWARNADEANQIVMDIARENSVRKVIKSKSMVTEEIHLNEALESAGMSVVETDLGEYIVQLAGDPPSHIVAPAAHYANRRHQRDLPGASGHPADHGPGDDVRCSTCSPAARVS